MLIVTNDIGWCKDIKEQLSQSFEMKDLGIASKCLGIEFQQEKDSSVILRQQEHVEAILNRFGMQEYKPTKTPINTKVQLIKPEKINEGVMKQYPY